ncbi:Glutathione S-transferase S1 [Actinomortierella ambigua]|nr:Glutathione S-transferase S1 [Actinomortierella ambigua]
MASAPWEAKVQGFENWLQVKPTLPFGTLPILTEKMANGDEVHIAESVAMERYLAKKYGLAGSTLWEETMVDMFYNQAAFINFKLLEKVIFAVPEESHLQAFENFMDKTLPDWVNRCEQHLARNGNKGCFVGDKVTLADIKTSTVLDIMISLASSEPFLNPNKTPCLFALKKRVDTHPSYAFYRKSPDYRSIDAQSQAAAPGVLRLDFDRSHIYA